jgi:hypothetical protein
MRHCSGRRELCVKLSPVGKSGPVCLVDPRHLIDGEGDAAKLTVPVAALCNNRSTVSTPEQGVRENKECGWVKTVKEEKQNVSQRHLQRQHQ